MSFVASISIPLAALHQIDTFLFSSLWYFTIYLIQSLKFNIISFHSTLSRLLLQLSTSSGHSILDTNKYINEYIQNIHPFVLINNNKKNIILIPILTKFPNFFHNYTSIYNRWPRNIFHFLSLFIFYLCMHNLSLSTHPTWK